MSPESGGVANDPDNASREEIQAAAMVLRAQYAEEFSNPSRPQGEEVSVAMEPSPQEVAEAAQKIREEYAHPLISGGTDFAGYPPGESPQEIAEAVAKIRKELGLT